MGTQKKKVLVLAKEGYGKSAGVGWLLAYLMSEQHASVSAQTSLLAATLR